MKAKKMWFGKGIFSTVLTVALLILMGAHTATADWERIDIGDGSMRRYLQDVDQQPIGSLYYLDSMTPTAWYENPDGGGNWPGYSTGWDIYGYNGQRAGDIDGDGLPDMVVGTTGTETSSPIDDAILVAINPGDEGLWDCDASNDDHGYHIGTLPATEDGVETVAIGDMDNDGYPDILAGGDCTELRWYINPGYMTDNWGYYTVYDFARDVEGMVIADFDNDDYLDIAVTTCHSNGTSGGVYVLINPQAREGSWDRVALDTQRRSYMETIAAGDIDQDGENDVIFANRQPSTDSYLYWYENLGSGTSWTRHTIDTLSTSSLNGYPPEVADIDLDGLPDVICYHYDDNVTYWYGNLDGGSTWEANGIYGGNVFNHGAIGDADNDYDEDIIYNGYLYINPTDKYLEVDLMGCWYLDEGTGTVAEDSSGFDNDGTISGATWTTGKIGYGLDFDGENDYVNCGNVKPIGETTVTTWFKSSSTKQYNGLFDFKGGFNRGQFEFNHLGDGKPLLYLGSANNRYFANCNAYMDGNWHFLVLYIKGGAAADILESTLSIDLTNIGVGSTGTGDDVQPWGDFRIGDGHYDQFDGTIDEVRIYSRALSEDEIYENYLAGDTRGYWRFNEGEGTTAADSSVDSNNQGTLVNMATATCWVNGRIGFALDFDGVDDYVDCGNDASLGITGKLTLEAWVKPSTVTQAQHILSKSYAHEYHVFAYYDGRLFFAHGDGAIEQVQWDGYFDTANVWYHVVLVRDPSDTKIYAYKNGIQFGTARTYTKTPTSSADTLKIGRRVDACSYWHGTIDEVRIYSRALSGDEIDQNYVDQGGPYGFGCEENPTGDPIGGGEGYSDILSTGDYIVSNRTELLDALASAASGEVVYVVGTAEIDLTGDDLILITHGVTLASNRGSGGSQGALLYTDQCNTSPLFYCGVGACVTGLCLRGPRDQTGDEVSLGIQTSYSGLEIDNCEISAWTYAGICLMDGGTSAYIHHNSIHHCMGSIGYGYGVAHSNGTADSIVEANLFEHCNHCVAGSGTTGNSYEACYNHVLAGSDGIPFDMHGGADRGDGTDIAGDTILIHHNTDEDADGISVYIRGIPNEGAWIHHNWFLYDGEGSAARQDNAYGNFDVYMNLYGLNRELVKDE